jgi:hypothetical protein
MKEHFCLAEKSIITYQGKCNWCGEKEWVGLTDEEVELYWDWEDFQCGCGPSTLFAMVRDIEARLKDRNI